MDQPHLALAMGDAAGISSELAARMLVDPAVLAACRLTLIGDARVLAEGARIAGVEPALEILALAGAAGKTGPGADASAGAGPGPIADIVARVAQAGLPAADRPRLVDLGHCDPADLVPGEVSAASGRFATDNFRLALQLAVAGAVAGVCFTPFNKGAMRLITPGYDDEIGFVAEATGFDGDAREFNILEGLWNARVTSHVPLAAVAGLLSEAAIVGNLRLTDRALRAAGVAQPRIAVAALNPHAGDNGNFGREEIEVIGPAVKAGQAAGIACEGPYPADTVFVRARRGDFDAVLTMYHDQGQIAMKLLGFEAGVTLMGGFPFPISTAAHGTAYDIVGKGKAHPGAMRNAILLAARMAARGGSAVER